MFLTCENGEQLSEHKLEAGFCRRRRDVRSGRLFSDQELQFGNEVDDKRPDRIHGALNVVPPLAKLSVGLAQNISNQTLESVRQGSVGNFALELIELAICEQAARQDQHLMQFVDD